MDVLLIVLSIVFALGGIIGSFLPILPGPPLSWLGVLFVFLAPSIPTDTGTIIYTAIIAMTIFVLDFVVPSIATKRFKGSKNGIYGSMIGLLAGLFVPIGLFFSVFLGALIGEYITHRNISKCWMPAVGSILGLFISSIMKLILAIVYLMIILKVIWDHKDILIT